MKFNLKTSGYRYCAFQAERLKKLGFKFDTSNTFNNIIPFKKLKSNLTINITSLKQLMEFINEWGEIVINKNTIEIYDDNRE